MQTIKVWALVIVFAALGGAQHLGRDFRATFRYSNPVREGTHVNVRVSVRIWNSGEHDLMGGSLEFHEQRDLNARIQAFSRVDVPKGSHQTLNGYIDISGEEFQAWEKGILPRLTLGFLDADGNRRELPVQVSQPMGEDHEN